MVLAIFKHIGGKIGACIAVIAGMLHFNENPVGISIFVFPLLLLILLYNYESIMLFEDRFVYIPPFYKPWRRPYIEFRYENLADAISPVEYNVENLPRKQLYLNKVDSRTKLHILYKDNSSFLFSTSIPWPYMRMAAKEIVRQAAKKAGVKN